MDERELAALMRTWLEDAESLYQKFDCCWR